MGRNHQNRRSPPESSQAGESLEVKRPDNETKTCRSGEEGEERAQPEWNFEQHPIIKRSLVDEGDAVGVTIDQLGTAFDLGYRTPEPSAREPFSSREGSFRGIQLTQCPHTITPEQPTGRGPTNSLKSLGLFPNQWSHLGAEQLDGTKNLFVRHRPDADMKHEALDPQKLPPANDLFRHPLRIAEDERPPG